MRSVRHRRRRCQYRVSVALPARFNPTPPTTRGSGPSLRSRGGIGFNAGVLLLWASSGAWLGARRTHLTGHVRVGAAVGVLFTIGSGFALWFAATGPIGSLTIWFYPVAALFVFFVILAEMVETIAVV